LIIEELTRYKFSLEENGPKLLEELQRYYHQDEEDAMPDIEGFPKGEGPKKVDYIRYENPYEAHLNAQIKVVDALIPILEQHIAFLEDDEDIDLVLESFEHSLYRVKKQTYTDVEDWEQLLEHLPEDRLDEIVNNPKGHGDLLIKELIWIRSYEDKWMKK
jgi:bacterioferritin